MNKPAYTVQPLTQAVAPLLAWYHDHERPLPWRERPTPYRVWISEVMLQQTRIEAVLPYFDRFMAALPTVAHLAQVEEDTLMKLWEGLGYYSRARNLQKAARQVMEQYGGELPASYEQLLTLPGIGEYTAGAVASIAFGIDVPAVDGNVLRVLARLLACREDVMRPAVRAQLRQIAVSLLPAGQAGAFNQAIMELGETVCLPNTVPRCSVCPIRPCCRAEAEGCASELPVRAPKKARRIEQRTILVVLSDETPRRVLLRRRDSDGLLANLWELPGLPEWAEDEAAADAIRSLGGQVSALQTLPPGKHIFSHIEWHMHGFCAVAPPFPAPEGCVWATAAQLEADYALPSAFRSFAGLLPVLMDPNQTIHHPERTDPA